MRIILIRHGETYSNTLFNTDKQFLIGALDNELTQLNEKGKLQAKKAKEKLECLGLLNSVDKIYSSDITRAIDTAKIIFDNQEIVQDCRLRERSHGFLEGVLMREINENPLYSQMMVSFEKDPVETCLNKKVTDGESYNDVIVRCKDFLSELDFEEKSTIAIVSHFHTLRVLVYLLQGKEFDFDFSQLMIENSNPMIAEYKKGQFEF